MHASLYSHILFMHTHTYIYTHVDFSVFTVSERYITRVKLPANGSHEKWQNNNTSWHMCCKFGLLLFTSSTFCLYRYTASLSIWLAAAQRLYNNNKNNQLELFEFNNFVSYLYASVVVVLNVFVYIAIPWCGQIICCCPYFCACINIL